MWRDTGGLVAYSGVAYSWLNPTTRTEIYRSLVPRVYIVKVIELEMVYNMPLELVIDLL
jgi:hypothetical protein